MIFFQRFHAVPEMRSSLCVKHPERSRVIGEKAWFSCLHNNHVEIIFPILSDQHVHPLVSVSIGMLLKWRDFSIKKLQAPNLRSAQTYTNL